MPVDPPMGSVGQTKRRLGNVPTRRPDERRGRPMPRVTTWKVPAALWALGFVAKIGLSFLVSDTVGSWVGGVLGFLALGTAVLYAYSRARDLNVRDGDPGQGSEGLDLFRARPESAAPEPRGDTPRSEG